ncbi:hypothetical protein GCM10011354_22170 [Egicoccus halophilus]|uniref:PKD domain-containing protein n=2 Tax=Egicoccus halophilus TaxID=1670830 RepID=A0A8J3EV01_9ACTN|nr:hypothetical protein GCM10011354_22170 [Egicoccus halophilus]
MPVGRALQACFASGVLILCALAPASAQADGEEESGRAQKEPPCKSIICSGGSAKTDGSTVDIVAVDRRPSSPGSSPERGKETSAVSSPCQYKSVGSWDPYVDQIDTSYFPADARWYIVNCDGDDLYRWYVPGDETDDVGPQALLREVIQTAFGSVEAGTGELRLAPAQPAPHVTGLPSWLAIEPQAWEPRSATVTAGSISVTATLAPLRVDWSLGDGGAVTCDGPGSIYDTSVAFASQSTDCSYTFAVASTLEGPAGTYAVSANIVYGASYVVSSPLEELNGSFELGELPGPATTEQVSVQQIQAVRTSSD